MKNQTQTLDRQILRELRGARQRREAYLEVSQRIVAGVMRGTFAQKEILRLLAKCRKITKEIIRENENLTEPLFKVGFSHA